MSESTAAAPTQPPARSMSVPTPASKVPSDGRFPPVLVLYHPSMETLAKKLVDVTSNRLTKLSLASKVDLGISLILVR